MTAASMRDDSGERRVEAAAPILKELFAAYGRKEDNDRDEDVNGGRFPNWFIRLVVTIILTSLATVIFGGSWWAATLSTKLDALQVSISQANGENAAKIKDIQDEEKLLDLKVQNLKTEFAVLKDRLERKAGMP